MRVYLLRVTIRSGRLDQFAAESETPRRVRDPDYAFLKINHVEISLCDTTLVQLPHQVYEHDSARNDRRSRCKDDRERTHTRAVYGPRSIEATHFANNLLKHVITARPW